MTTKQLIDRLAQVDPNKRVYIQSEEVEAVRDLGSVVLLVLHSETTAVDLMADQAASAAPKGLTHE